MTDTPKTSPSPSAMPPEASASISSNVQPVGVDDGHYGVKVCAGPASFFTLPSRAHPGRLEVAGVNGGRDESLVYETAAGEYVTITAHDMLSPALDTRLSDYPTSSTNRALVYHALRQTGIVNDVFMVTGLPVNRFYQPNGERNTALIEAKRDSLMRPVFCADKTILPHVAGHKVISEAVAAYYDALLDFHGGYNQSFKEISDEEPIAVVDAGGKTLDIATVKEGGTGIYQAQSGTADAGVLYLYDLLAAALKSRFDIQDEIPFTRLQKTLETGTYRLYGERHDVKVLVAQQLDAFAERVCFEVKKLLGDASRFGKVLFVGGGANLLADRLNLVFPGLPRNAITVAPSDDNPKINAAFANARGMYKAALVDTQSRQ